MYPLDTDQSLTRRPPTGLQWRLPKDKRKTSTMNQVEPMSAVQPLSTSRCNFSQRPSSATPERFPQPPSIPCGRPRTASMDSLRPQSAKSVLRERPKSAKKRDETSLQLEEEIPQSLQPLATWRTAVSYHCTGLDDSIRCLVYLPSLVGVERLPTLPPPTGPEAELEYSSVILPKEVWKPKKYKSPYVKPASREPACNHSSKVRLYDEDGDILYERYTGDRTRGIVRKEIVELERLMEGLTTDGSNCLVVQLQGDISRTNKMVRDTLEQASSLRDALPSEPEPAESIEPEEPSDLMQFYHEHVEIIAQIRQQHKICLRELAGIEATLDIPADQRQFPLAEEVR